jgi:putative molybdopterin biosynthesis protein
MENEYLKVRDVADQLKLSPMSIYRLIEQRELSAVRVGRSYRIKKTDLDAYLARAAV